MVEGGGGLNATLAIAFCGIPLCALLCIVPLGILGMFVRMYVCMSGMFVYQPSFWVWYVLRSNGGTGAICVCVGLTEIYHLKYPVCGFVLVTGEA